MVINVTSSLRRRRAPRSPAIHSANRSSPRGPVSARFHLFPGVFSAFFGHQAPVCQGVGHQPEAIARLASAIGPYHAPDENFFRGHASAHELRSIVELARVVQRKGAEQTAAAGVKQAGVTHGNGLPLMTIRPHPRPLSRKRARGVGQGDAQEGGVCTAPHPGLGVIGEIPALDIGVPAFSEWRKARSATPPRPGRHGPRSPRPAVWPTGR